MAEVLQKIIAASSLASRRGAQEMIKEGLVKVNGQVAVLGDRADPRQDKITISGRLISPPTEKIYLKLNKPTGHICTNRKFAGEKNIFDLIKISARLFTVGRLDKDSHGLILLTNDGDLAQRLAHPRFGHEKVYEVKVRGEIKNGLSIVQRLIDGINIGEGDGIVRAKKAEYLQNGVFVITLSEGKKRQIRRMFKILDIGVTDLKRTIIGNLQLGSLKTGQWEYLKEEEIKELKK